MADTPPLLDQIAARLSEAEDGQDGGPAETMASLVSPDLAITPNRSLGAPPDIARPVLLSSPRWPGGVRLLARARAWDEDLDVVVLQLEHAREGLPSVPLAADPPAPGSVWRSIGFPPGSAEAVLLTGTVRGVSTRDGRTLLDLDSSQSPISPSGLAGAQVLVDDRLVGILTPTASDGGVDLLAVPVSAMAEAKGEVGDAIRRLLADAELGEALFDRLSSWSRRALEAADAIRRARRQDRVHMEHLVFGLFQEQDGPTRRAFAAAEVDEQKLRKIIVAAVHATIPGSWDAVELTGFPPLSPHVRQALIAARDAAGPDGSAPVESRHLLHGAFSVVDCTMIGALRQAGVELPPPVAGFEPDLPFGVDAFVGRESEMKSVLSTLRQAGTPGRSRPPVVVLRGPFGIGKTSLALRAAQLVGDQFPDGTILVWLRELPDPVQGLRRALEHLGAELPDRPDSLDELVQRYRQATAAKRVLVVVDDAERREQVEPLLPTNPACAVLVTSHAELAIPGAEQIDLRTLDRAEVAEYLRQVLGGQGIEVSDELVTGVAAVSAGYPQAVSVTSSAFQEAPPERVTELLQAEQQAMEQAPTAVAPDLLERYESLDADAQELFRLLCVVTDADFTEGLAAALLETDESAARERLDRLAAAGLLDSPEPGRYHLPEAARAVAQDRLRADVHRSEQHLARARAIMWLVRAEQLQADGERAAGRRAMYGSDSVPGAQENLEDHLDMEREVDAISWVVAARDVAPPLSVGLFGDWGTGKSYFMQLMQRRVNDISATAQQEERAGRMYPACPYVRQITFNAWHYVDANLWASLVTHIFEELAKPEGEPDEQAQREVRRLLEQLETAQALRREAEDKRAQAVEERRRLEGVRRHRENTIRDLAQGKVEPGELATDEDIRARAATMKETVDSGEWTRLRRGATAGLLEAMKEVMTDPALLRSAVELLPDDGLRGRLLNLVNDPATQESLSRFAGDPGRIGRLIDGDGSREQILALLPDSYRRGEIADLTVQLLDIYKDVMALRRLADDLRTIGGKLAYLWRSLRTSKPWRRRSFQVAMVLLVVFGGLTAYLAFGPGPSLAQVWSVGAGLVASLSWLLSLVRGPVSQVRKAVDLTVEAVDRKARRQIELLQAQEAQLQREIEEARRLESEAERELEDIRQGRRLYRYIEERARSSDYQKYLGVIALVRKDFERLAELMDEARTARARQRHDRQAPAVTPQPVEGLPRIDRVILYIDDLDRCPTDRVVQVLEAVHLLLALRLFVVVVGVDSRWLLRSLQRHYRAQLSTEGTAGPGPDDDLEYLGTTPQNYLEKIFQIAFSIRPMDPTGYGRLLDHLFRGPVPEEALLEAVRTPDPPPEPVAEAQEDGGLAGPDAPPDQAVTTGPSDGPQDGPTSTVPQPPKPEDGETAGGGLTEPTPPVQPTAEPTMRRPDPRPAAKPPDALEISTYELEFMKRLARFVPTPRSAKRLANTYRLLRVLVTDAETPWFGPTGNGSGHYQVALTALAMLIGFPTQAATVFRELLTADDDSWPAFVARLIQQQAHLAPVEPHPNGQDGAEEQPHDGSKAAPVATVRGDHHDQRREEEEREGWDRLSENLRALMKDSPLLVTQLGPYRYWSRRVARYSFQTGRLPDVNSVGDERTWLGPTPMPSPDAFTA